MYVLKVDAYYGMISLSIDVNLPMVILKQIEYWKTSGQRDLKTAESLFELRRYDVCLFFCHLALEKLLKGIVVAHTSLPAPYVHDLAKLAKVAGIPLSEEQLSNLRTITTFNIAARYDDEKFAFYKQCTRPYAAEYFEITQSLFIWLKKHCLKKS